MPNVSSEVVALLSTLLPGFFAAWIFYGLTAYTKPHPFERTVQALIFNIIIIPFAAILEGLLLVAGRVVSLAPWTTASSMITSVVLAGCLGLIAAGIANSDNVHAWLRSRDWRFRQRTQDSGWVWTFRTSHPSEWYSALSRRAQYVVLHLEDDRRLYGWPDEWPDQSEAGHFVISEAEWLVDDVRQELAGVEAILIPSRDVRYIEFMKPDSKPSREPAHVG